MNQAVRKAATQAHTNRRLDWFAGLSSGPTAATPPAAAAFDVPTAGVPTYSVEGPLLATDSAEGPAGARGAAAAAGRGAEGVAEVAGVPGGGAAVSAGSPSKAVTSASFNAGSPLRLRRACSAATEERLHFFPVATIAATSALMVPPAAGVAEGAAGAVFAGTAGAFSAGEAEVGSAGAGGGVGAELPSPVSHGICTPARKASISASVRSGRPERLR
jgi:hypothetical protein